MITAAHLSAAMLLKSTKNDNFTTFVLFMIGIIGGQGACIIFISTLSYMLSYHSIICSHLLNALLFSYFLGSDTFHTALKFGVFPDMAFDKFIVLIAIGGVLVYVASALVFKKMKKDKGGLFTSGLAKGLLLKKNVQMYIFIQAVFLILSFMFTITFQQYSYWGSRVLCIVLGLNLFVPAVAISLLNKEAMKKSMGTPSDTDEFLMKKGGSADLEDAKNTR